MNSKNEVWELKRKCREQEREREKERQTERARESEREKKELNYQTLDCV
jgi:hypothetical protein